MKKIKFPAKIFFVPVFISAIASALAEPSVPTTKLATEIHAERAALTGNAEPPANSLVLWYREPAETWNAALPVGNGKLGAMIFGGVAREQIALNEDSVWEGYKRNADNTNALAALPEIRGLLFADKDEEATKLVGDTMMGVPSRLRSYQPLGDLWLDFPGVTNVENYRRDLDLNDGIASVTYQIGDDIFTRKVFASYPDNVIVVEITCNHPHKINLQLAMSRPLDAKSFVDPKDPHRIILRGQIMAQYFTDPKPIPAMKFESQTLVIPSGGKISTSGGKIIVSNADSVELLTAGASDYWGGHPEKICRDNLAKASKKIFNQSQQRPIGNLRGIFAAGIQKKSSDELQRRHIADFQSLFKRVDLDLGANPAAEKLPTDERLKKFDGTNDPSLFSLYFQFDRYLLMSCSRPGSLPANLQGNWNIEPHAAWNSDYHLNINIQMNYWPAEVCNLSECQLPLFNFMDMLATNGARTAKIMYDARGWVAHHASDPFGFTSPADSAVGVWPMGAAWMSQHPWEHYLFTGDKKFLAEQGYPLMRGAAQFILDFMVPAPTNTPFPGKLVTAPSLSPENKFLLPDGTMGELTYGTTMDLEIIYDLLTHCIEASKVLDTDADFRAECEAALTNLPPLQIKSDGRLQEWLKDYQEQDIHHRHTSHLFAVYPGDEISVNDTPKLAAAAEKSLIVRGDSGATEWSLAWRAALWARFLEPERAYGQIENIFRQPETNNAGRVSFKSNLYPNLFNKYPPFQIDGNLGAAAAFAEMLLQSQGDKIQLLPALPAEWSNGHINGLLARGGFEVSENWSDGKLSEAKILSKLGGNLRVSSTVALVRADGKDLQEASLGNPNPFFATAPVKPEVVSHDTAGIEPPAMPKEFVYDIPTRAGETIELKAK